MKCPFILFLSLALLSPFQQVFASCIVETQTLYLSGTGSDDAVEWEFYCTAGARSGEWTTIPVPSCWECQGFGQYVYGLKSDQDRLKESGLYRHTFSVPRNWKGECVRIVFCGVMTDAEVRINGKLAGEKHQGGYYEFSYDVTSLLRYGRDNLLEVRVDKASSNESVQNAERFCDFWIYGGIYRPVYLEARPSSRICDAAIDARADGQLRVDVDVAGAPKSSSLRASVSKPDGTLVWSTESSLSDVSGRHSISGLVPDPMLWSAEHPNLYILDLTLVQNGQVLHHVSQKIGFRTFELRPHDGVYLNGKRIIFKGVNRHSHWPTTGRTLNHEINLKDAMLIKEMNMNAVRMSHYPPDKDFLDICDSLGLYVLDELTGWQSCYDTEVGSKLVHEMVIRDRNHPSVLMWDNGNEGGFNFDLLPFYSADDIQNRPVIHPWQKEDGWNTFHYPSWSEVYRLLHDENNVYFPTESIHGLYDGGHGAGLEDYWNLMSSSPLSAGCFLWDLVDQGVARLDMDGFLDTDGDHGADGILGPYREKEGSFYTIKDVWCPVQPHLGRHIPKGWDGSLVVENRYTFTNLKECSFEVEFFKVDYFTGKRRSVHLDVTSPDVEPGLTGRLNIPLPDEVAEYDFFTLKATDCSGMELYSWTRSLHSTDEITSVLLMDNPGCTVLTDTTGMVSGFQKDGKVLPLTNGPRLVSSVSDDNKVEFSMNPSGWLEVSYSYFHNGEYDNIGVTFDFPEDKVTGIRWLGNGPYRVWKNRLRGVEPGLWTKDYNDTMTGMTFDYPEFKGYHSGIYAADILTEYGTLRIVSDTEDLYLHLLTPSSQGNANVSGHFPDGDISILSAISPVGTKFCPPSSMGPSGQVNRINNGHGALARVRGHFYMTFLPF